LTTLQDSELIERTLTGEDECFAVLMSRHIAAVRRRVTSMVRNTSDAEDFVQETFLSAWRHLSAFRSDASFRTWITRIAINEVFQEYRRNRLKFTGPYATDLAGFASRDESPHEALVHRETREAVRGAVAKLPEKYRLVLVLRDLDECTTREAARSLAMGIPAVKTRLLRARHMLAEAIAGQRAA